MNNNKTNTFHLYIFISLIILSITSCTADSESINISNNSVCSDPIKLTGQRDNLNISVFFDLSDRISPTFHPNSTQNYWERDLGYVNSIVDAFEMHCRNKKVNQINDKITAYFHPLPENISDINNIINELSIEVNSKNALPEFICSISDIYEENLNEIYKKTLSTKEPYAEKGVDEYPGSDIYDFIKYKASDYCIKDGYRNILFIITDGYMYMKGSEMKNGNKTNYVLPKSLKSWFKSSNFESKFDSENFGFITPETNLSNLEIIILGINPEEYWHYDLLNMYWSKWLNELEVENFKEQGLKYLKKADLPSELNEFIQNYIYNKKT
jgi:hypothetical protein